MDLVEHELDDIDRLLTCDLKTNDFVKVSTLKTILDLSSSIDGCLIFVKHFKILQTLFKNVCHSNEEISKLACSVLINFSAEKEVAEILVQPKSDGFNPIHILVEEITHKESPVADDCVTILCNLAHHSNLIENLIDLMTPADQIIMDLLKVCNCVKYNVKGCHLHSLPSLFSNLTQSIRIRRYFLNKENRHLSMLLPFADFKDSNIRRQGVLGTIMNCCFETEEHPWLLSSDVDILPILLLPLAGNEEFDDEDNSQLPIELQYLDQSKTRDDDPIVRKTALDALYMLCATKEGRVYLRDHNAYIILREYHKWEKDRSILLVCDNVIHVLIRKECEIGVEKIMDLDVPEDLKEKFAQMDDEFIEDN